MQMRRELEKCGGSIRQLLEWFYPPFRRVVSRQVFLYGVTGGVNIVFDWVLYFVVYNFVLQKQNLSLPFFTFSPHVAALGISFPISFFTGFLLQKYVTFSASLLRGRTQIIRYLLVVALNLTINFLGIKLLVDVFHFYPTPSKMAVTVVTILVSFLCQKRFTFKA